MKSKIILSSIGLACTAVLVGQLSAIAADRDDASLADSSRGTVEHGVALAGSGECDVAVSMLGGGNDYNAYGLASGKYAYAMATTSCNVGDIVCEWLDTPSNFHPLIAQNVYMLHNGDFKQIGASWLKHSFCAVSEPTCGSCQSTGCSTLGIGCADTYWAGLNASGLGPRNEVNPQGDPGNGGTHVHPQQGASGPWLGRVAIDSADVNVAGAQYYAEAHYVTRDEIVANRHNNASWREVNVTAGNMSNVDGVVKMFETGINAWKEDGGATLTHNDHPTDGRVSVAMTQTDNGNGTWTYRYMVHNMNSEWGVSEFRIPVQNCIDLTNIESSRPERHSGDVRASDAWTIDRGDGYLRLYTDNEAANPNSSQIAWGESLSVKFIADAPQGGAAIELAPHMTGGSTRIQTFRGPRNAAASNCDSDVVATCQVDVADLLRILADWGLGAVLSDVNDDGSVDVADLLQVLAEWGTTCP